MSGRKSSPRPPFAVFSRFSCFDGLPPADLLEAACFPPWGVAQRGHARERAGPLVVLVGESDRGPAGCFQAYLPGGNLDGRVERFGIADGQCIVLHAAADTRLRAGGGGDQVAEVELAEFVDGETAVILIEADCEVHQRDFPIERVPEDPCKEGSVLAVTIESGEIKRLEYRPE